MKINKQLLVKAESDLGLNAPFVKGQEISVKNCWHFSTDGNALDQMFFDDEDFRNGMNRIYVVAGKYHILILAFVLMDTHVHFLLYGEYDECNRFVHDYVKRTSQYISFRHSEKNKLDNVPVGHQTVDTESYLKTVICYIVKNPTEAGLAFLPHNYPYSSGPLYFATKDCWTSPAWCKDGGCYMAGEKYGHAEFQRILKTKDDVSMNVTMCDRIIFPGEYVTYELVERIYRTCRSFNYFMCRTKESDVDSKEGRISYLTIPIQEMKQNRTEVMMELFNVGSIRKLDTGQRIRLAKVLRSRYNSSLKQIVRICGLSFNEVKDLF